MVDSPRMLIFSIDQSSAILLDLMAVLICSMSSAAGRSSVEERISVTNAIAPKEPPPYPTDK